VAAKEMVYLAEEGLKTEGQCFDHAWQVNFLFNIFC
jgi:phage tail protein X